MKKNTIIKIATTSLVVISMSCLSFKMQKELPIKKEISLTSKLSAISIGTNNALATTVASYHTSIYNSAKTEVNTEVKSVIDAINTLLTAAKITSCSSIPAVSATAFYTNGTHDLYSSATGGRLFPLTITGKTFNYTHKLELKLTTGSTPVGALYLDCTNGGYEVRYLGKSDSNDTDLAIAYYQDASGYQTILLASDYLAGTGYAAAKLAVYYVENASSQSVTYAYNETGTAVVGTITANSSGGVTAATDGAVTTGTEVNDLTSLIGTATTFATTYGPTIAL